MSCGIFILLCGFYILPVSSNFTRQTTLGLVRGKLEQWDNKSVECYLGIPYAAPPMKSLRFQPPQPHPGWKKPLDTIKFGPICPQQLLSSGQLYGNEDCLRLNIYVPHKERIPDVTSELFSVMVWIHGGAFVLGSGNYKAHVLADFGQVVVVTINYRLGVLGFLSTGDSAAVGNSGLLDQQFAILWVKANIRNFGGNPNAITIFGQSSGGASVGLQCLSPLSSGLFKRAILDSGVPITPWATQLDNPLPWVEKLASIVSCPVSDSLKLISCLQRKTTLELIEGAIQLTNFNFTFVPTIDGSFLPKPPLELFENISLVGRFSYMAGVNSHEGSTFWPWIKEIKSQADFANYIMLFLQVETEKMKTVSDTILWQYRDWMDLNYSSFHIQRQTLDAVGDVGFVAPLVMTSDFITKASKVYVYYFTRRPNASVLPEWIGAGHGDELTFVFGIPIFAGPLIGEEEHVLNQQIMSYWTNFAKTGNPNSPMKVQVTWPKYNKRTSQYLQLDINLSKLNIKRQLKTEEVVFWNQHIPRLLKVEQCPVTKPLNDPVVRTENGLLRGIRNVKDKIVMDIFKGIPFAQPPLGEFRFQRPAPLTSWKGIKEASEYGSVCLQDRIYNREVWGDEDCLYLNIWVPNGVEEALEKKLAVMIWIHGGAFALGSGQGVGIINSTWYDGYELAHQGNVIVVNINYRLAALGFLSTGDENGRGNYGLWDQHMAIKWVKTNIAHFGGNPGLITLFGESAGGASTSMHALSPVSKGLFRRVISESGDAQTMWAVNRRPLGAARRVARAVGCPWENKAAMMFCLRRVPAEDIVLAVRVTEALSNKEILFFLPFVPTIDGEFLPDEPAKLFQNSKEIDYLVGCNNGDAHLFLSIWFPGVNIPFGISEAKFRAATEKGVGSLGQAAVESVLFEYTDWKNPSEFSRRFGLVRMYTDMQFCAPAFSSARKHAEISRNASSTYTYLFVYPSRIPNLILPEWVGAIHTGELQFLFGKPFSSPKIYNQQERELSRAMINYWTNFAKTGNPNHPKPVPAVWPEYDDKKYHMELNVNMAAESVGSNLNPKSFAMWNELIPKMVHENLECFENEDPSPNGTVSPPEPPLVTIHQGQVKGFSVEDFLGGYLNVFLGIPYATPPVGNLRFQPPADAKPWDGLLEATQLGPACPQLLNHLPDGISDTSEDCLYLNIYAPVQPGTILHPLPVMVYIHPGSLQSGAAGAYDLKNLAAYGQIVAVEFSYRLGLFGFLSTMDEHAPGNVGFLDMIKGLQWIKENIQYFGGDPNNVTLFGHGAGGLAVNYLLLSPLTKGLLHRAISSSGNALVPGSTTELGIMYSDPLSTGKELAKRLGCPTDSNKNIVNCLQAKPMESLLNATMPKPKYGLTFLPVIDGAFLPESPQEMLLRGKYMKVPYIIGLTSDEAGAYLDDLLIHTDGIETEDYHNLILDYVSNHFRNNLAQIVEVVTYFYRDFKDPNNPATLRDGFRLLVQDHKWLAPSYRLADLHSNRTNTFLYIYSHRPSFSQEPLWVGASHLDDLLYLLGDPVARTPSHQYTLQEKELSFSLMAYWTNFAHTGNPNRGLHGTLLWPHYTAAGTEFMNFTADGLTSVGRFYRRQDAALWSELVSQMQCGEWCSSDWESSTPGTNTTTAGPTISQPATECEEQTQNVLTMQLTATETVTAFYISFALLFIEAFTILGLLWRLYTQRKKLEDRLARAVMSEIPLKGPTDKILCQTWF